VSNHRGPIALIAAFFAATPFVALAPIAASATSEATSAPYYLALGDSLAQGVQPDLTGQNINTDQGYADDLYSAYRHQVPGLQLAKLGCTAETTTTMIQGGVCSYGPNPSQLDAATAFLRTHNVILITIDIGGDNVDTCLSNSGINLPCIYSGIATADTDLPTILSELRTAAPDAQIVGMNYYDPFLADWLQGATGQTIATQSVSLTQTFNKLLETIYAAFGVSVADVQSSYQTTNFTPVTGIGLPVNVAAICTLTWMCAPPPLGGNDHANLLGYGIIASTLQQQIGTL
jgi:lysophospholipase L1-like esterase